MLLPVLLEVWTANVFAFTRSSGYPTTACHLFALAKVRSNEGYCFFGVSDHIFLGLQSMPFSANSEASG